MLRIALLGENAQEPSDETSIVMQGPLAEIYRKALNVAYANEDPLSGKPSMESQAQDQQYADLIANALLREEETHLGPLTVYGVSRVDATPDDLVEVAQTATGVEAPESFILVSDYTQPGPNGEVGAGGEMLYPVSAAMESMVLALGGHVVHSLEELKTLCIKGLKK
jgi:hypothetical protein